MPANYDNSAAFYDRLSRLVFGKALINAQVFLLPYIPKNAKVLIVGGGTGWILDEISKLHSSGLSIIYVEISAKMIALSRKRNIGSNAIEFINTAIEDAGLPADFDVVITPFFFDNFTDESLPALFEHIYRCLKPESLWLNTDFQLTGKWWQYAILKSMLLFFKVLCNVPSWRLPNVEKQFTRFGCELMVKKTFFKDFVVSKVYKKLI